MKRKYDAKIAFLRQRPRLLQYIRDVDFSLKEVISIEVRRDDQTHKYLFRGLEFAFLVETDKDFSFFRNRLKFNDVLV